MSATPERLPESDDDIRGGLPQIDKNWGKDAREDQNGDEQEVVVFNYSTSRCLT